MDLTSSPSPRALSEIDTVGFDGAQEHFTAPEAAKPCLCAQPV